MGRRRTYIYRGRARHRDSFKQRPRNSAWTSNSTRPTLPCLTQPCPTSPLISLCISLAGITNTLLDARFGVHVQTFFLQFAAGVSRTKRKLRTTANERSGLHLMFCVYVCMLLSGLRISRFGFVFDNIKTNLKRKENKNSTMWSWSFLHGPC